MGSLFRFLLMESHFDIHAKSVSEDHLVLVRNTSPFSDVRQQIMNDTGIDISDQVWRCEDRLVQTLRMLETSDEESEAETPQKAQRSSSSSSVLPVFQVGGAKAGKRKVADIEDGDEKKTACQDTLWAFKTKADATGCSGHAVANLLLKLQGVYAKSKDEPEVLLKERIKNFNGQETRKVLKDLSSVNSKKPELKVQILSKVIFKETLKELRETASQVAEGIKMTQVATELILLSSCSDEAENIGWGRLTDLLTSHLSKKPRTTSRGTATGETDNEDEDDEDNNDPPDDPMDGSKGDGDDENDEKKPKGKGRGRPKRTGTV